MNRPRSRNPRIPASYATSPAVNRSVPFAVSKVTASSRRDPLRSTCQVSGCPALTFARAARHSRGPEHGQVVHREQLIAGLQAGSRKRRLERDRPNVQRAAIECGVQAIGKLGAPDDQVSVEESQNKEGRGHDVHPPGPPAGSHRGPMSSMRFAGRSRSEASYTCGPQAWNRILPGRWGQTPV